MQSEQAMLKGVIIDLVPEPVAGDPPEPMRLEYRAQSRERFPEKWTPVFRKKARQNKELEPRSDAIGTEKALARRETIALGERAAAGGVHRGRTLLLAVTVAAVLHVVAAYCLCRTHELEMAGAGGEAEAAGIELVEGSAVESMASAASVEVAASNQVNTSAGEESVDQQAPLTAADTARGEKTEPPPIEVNARDAEIAASAEPKPDAKPELVEVKSGDGEGKDDTRNPEQDGHTNGGAASRGASEYAIASEAAVAASEGEMSRYAAGVHAALLRQRPHHGGASGRVKIFFVLSPSGDVLRADLQVPSGDTSLDRMVLEAVRRAHFPAPPAHATERQLSYTTAFNFR